ncbi:hypothetical protein QTP88_018466 [Uroleucon formosanum]
MNIDEKLIEMVRSHTLTWSFMIYHMPILELQMLPSTTLHRLDNQNKKRTSSPGNSPTSKAINNNLDKFTYTTPNRYEALNALSEESNNENDVANVQMLTENTIQPPTPPPIFIITKVNYQNSLRRPKDPKILDIRQHINELQHILSKNNADIALISETLFTPNTCAKIYGFNAYFSCHPNGTAHAGAAIYIKSNITHHSLPPYSTPHIRAASVSLVVPNTYLSPFLQFIALLASSPPQITYPTTSQPWVIASSLVAISILKTLLGVTVLPTPKAEL